MKKNKKLLILFGISFVVVMMFILNYSGQFTLSGTSTWNVTSINYTNNFKNVGSEESNPISLYFKPDGTKMYIGGIQGKIFQYSLSTPWNISTAMYEEATNYLPGQIVGLYFKPDGRKMYIGSYGLYSQIYQYSLSTPWDISTITYEKNITISGSGVRGLHFKPDGTRFYISAGLYDKDVIQYSLSTPWDISTQNYLNGVNLGMEYKYPLGTSFKSDGTNLYVIEFFENILYQYSLSTPWNISTASLANNKHMSSEGTQINGLYIKQDGSSLYVIDRMSARVLKYDFSYTEPTPSTDSNTTEETVKQPLIKKDTGNVIVYILVGLVGLLAGAIGYIFIKKK